MITKWWVDKDEEGYGCCLLYGIIPTFSCRDLVKLSKTSARISALWIRLETGPSKIRNRSANHYTAYFGVTTREMGLINAIRSTVLRSGTPQTAQQLATDWGSISRCRIQTGSEPPSLLSDGYRGFFPSNRSVRIGAWNSKFTSIQCRSAVLLPIPCTPSWHSDKAQGYLYILHQNTSKLPRKSAKNFT
jgi:hypothetical protein